MTRRSGTLPLWMKLLLALCSLGAALLSTELVLRLARYEYTPLSIRSHQPEDSSAESSDFRMLHAFKDDHFVYDPKLIWRPRRSTDTFNAQGFRGPLLSSKKAPGEFRIFAIGDSNTLGEPGSAGPNWPGYLGALLAKTDPRFVLVNAAAYGYSSFQGVARFEEVLPFEPDLVLISFGSNDAHQVKVPDADFVRNALGREAPFLASSRFFQLLLAAADRMPKKAKAQGPAPRVSVKDFEQNLERIIDEAARRKIRCVLLTRPYVGSSTDPLWWMTYAPVYREATLAVGSRRGVLVLDLYQEFKDQGAFFADESHFTGTGHRLAGTLLARELLALLRRESALNLPEKTFDPAQVSAELDLGTPQAHDAQVSGFSGDETNERGTVVWSKGESSSLLLSLDLLDQPYALAVDAIAYAPLAPLTVEVSANGKSAGALTFGSQWQTAELEIPVGLLNQGANLFTFRYGRSGEPKRFDPSNDDGRQLALMYDRVALVPAPRR